MNNNEEKVTFVDFKKEAFKRKVKEKVETATKTVKKAVARTIIWAYDNPVQAVGAITGLGVIATKAAKIHSVNAEDRRRDTDFYDPRTGVHSIAKRPLKPKEKVEILERYKSGESYAEILYRKGLLKK